MGRAINPMSQAGSVAADAGRLTLQDNVSSCRLRHFGLRCAGEAFDPFLVIAVERAGMFAPELLEEPGALLCFLSQHMAAMVRRRDDPGTRSNRSRRYRLSSPTRACGRARTPSRP